MDHTGNTAVEAKAETTPESGGVFTSLRARLFWLVLMAILPALIVVFYTAIEQRRAAKEEATKSGQRLVGLAAANHRQQLEAVRQLLQSLSQMREVRPERRAECAALFANLIAFHTACSNIVAIDPDGRAFASTLASAQEDFADRAWFREARESLKFFVGDYRVVAASGRAVLDLAQPVRDPDSGRLVAVLGASVDLGWITAMAGRLGLAEGSTLTVIDRTGLVLARYTVPESVQNWVGQKVDVVRPTDRLRGSSDLVWVGEGLDKVRRLFTGTPLSRTGGLADAYVVLGVPADVTYARANRMLAQNLLFLGLVAVLALGAAWVGGDLFILRYMRALVGAARRMSGGDLTARTGVVRGPGEMVDLARSFDAMASSLERRVRELQLAADEMTALNEELEERVLEQTAELKRSNEDLAQFAYVASHDLQEPLRMIHNYLQLLRQRHRDRLDPASTDFIGFALDGAKRMNELIHDVLLYSRVGTHGQDFAPVDCGEAWQRALFNLSLAIEESNAVITRDDLPVVDGDLAQLTQMFQNLIGNAIKFRSERRPEIHGGARLHKGEWEMTVRDNGIGIAQQDFQRVFTVFQRLHSRDKYPGNGIGLAVCKKIVERHGGRIWLESKLGRGTTFHFVLPVRAGTVLAADEGAGPGGPGVPAPT